ncbi:MAG: RNA polymerase sigma-70 factor [Bacteroidota bacterium]
MSHTDADQQILEKLRQGDTMALDALFRKYYVRCCQGADRILRDPAAAEDVVQELFLSLWKRRATLPVMDNVRAYLLRATRNRSLNYLRDQARIPQGDGEMPDLPTAANVASSDLELSELQARVDAAIDSLPERCRLVYVLCRLEEMSHKEVAASLEISTKTVENQMRRAYAFLREYLSLILLLPLMNGLSAPFF